MSDVIVFTGLPGTGKSTLAERLASDSGVPAFAGDWLLGALTPYRVLGGLEREAFIGLHDNLLRTLITRQLLLAQSAIADCVANDALAADWRELAASHGARFHVVECVCSDTALHRARLTSRVRGIPGRHEVDWAHVERMREEYPPLTVDRLVVDAVRPLEENLRAVREFTGLSAREG